MSTSSISSQNSALQALLLQSRQDLQTLKTDLGSGNLRGAQSDFAAFQKDAMSLFQGSNGQRASQSSAQTGTSQTAADLQTLKSALSSGDIGGAQKALTTFEQDIRNQMHASGHKHHHGQHHEDTDAAKTANAASSNGTGNPTAANGPAAVLNPMTLASLFSAYKAFNMASTAGSSGLSLIG